MESCRSTPRTKQNLTSTTSHNTGTRFSNGQAFQQERHSGSLATGRYRPKHSRGSIDADISKGLQNPNPRAATPLTRAKATHLLEECRGGLLPVHQVTTLLVKSNKNSVTCTKRHVQSCSQQLHLSSGLINQQSPVQQ